MSHLFDPAPFTSGTPKRARKQSGPPPAPVVVKLGHNGWRLVSINKNPGAHVVVSGAEADQIRRTFDLVSSGAVVTLCRRAGTPLTFDTGTKAAACTQCIQRGGAP